jgi:hypothetical protein
VALEQPPSQKPPRLLLVRGGFAILVHDPRSAANHSHRPDHPSAVADADPANALDRWSQARDRAFVGLTEADGEKEWKAPFIFAVLADTQLGAMEDNAVRCPHTLPFK